MVPGSRTSACATAAALLLQPFWMAVAQDAPQQPTQAPGRIRVTSELVLVNVVVRDKNGDLVRGLKKEDFTVYEDGKQQGKLDHRLGALPPRPTAGQCGLACHLPD